MQIDRYRGDTYADKFMVSVVDGSVANLTNCQIRLTVSSDKNPKDSSTQIYQIVGTVDDPSSGVVEFLPNPSQVDRCGMFYYDIQITDADGIIRTVAKDVYMFHQDITK